MLKLRFLKVFHPFFAFQRLLVNSMAYWLYCTYATTQALMALLDEFRASLQIKPTFKRHSLADKILLPWPLCGRATTNPFKKQF